MTDCCICLDEMTKVGIVVLECGHQIHFDCFMKMIRFSGVERDKCPMCRANVLTNKHLAEIRVIEESLNGDERHVSFDEGISGLTDDLLDRMIGEVTERDRVRANRDIVRANRDIVRANREVSRARRNIDRSFLEIENILANGRVRRTEVIINNINSIVVNTMDDVD